MILSVRRSQVRSQNRSQINQNLKSKMECLLASILDRFWQVWGGKLGGKIDQNRWKINPKMYRTKWRKTKGVQETSWRILARRPAECAEPGGGHWRGFENGICIIIWHAVSEVAGGSKCAMRRDVRRPPLFKSIHRFASSVSSVDDAGTLLTGFYVFWNIWKFLKTSETSGKSIHHFVSSKWSKMKVLRFYKNPKNRFVETAPKRCGRICRWFLWGVWDF